LSVNVKKEINKHPLNHQEPPPFLKQNHMYLLTPHHGKEHSQLMMTVMVMVMSVTAMMVVMVMSVAVVVVVSVVAVMSVVVMVVAVMSVVAVVVVLVDPDAAHAEAESSGPVVIA